MMAVGTLSIAVVPGYATIGLMAPVLVLIGRLLQGFSAGGEVSTISAFVAEYAGEQPFGIVTREREGVGMADARVADLYQNFSRLWRIHVDLDDFERFSRSEGNGGARFHGLSSTLHLR